MVSSRSKLAALATFSLFITAANATESVSQATQQTNAPTTQTEQTIPPAATPTEPAPKEKYYAQTNNEKITISLKMMSNEDTKELLNFPLRLLAKADVRLMGEKVQLFPNSSDFESYRGIMVEIKNDGPTIYFPRAGFFKIKGLQNAFISSEKTFEQYKSFGITLGQYFTCTIPFIVGGVCKLAIRHPAAYLLTLLGAGASAYGIFKTYQFHGQIDEIVTPEYDDTDFEDDSTAGYHMIPTGKTMKKVIFIDTKHVTPDFLKKCKPEFVYSFEKR